MFAQLIEFTSNHYVLTGSFAFLLVLLIITEMRKGGQNLTCRQLTAMVNADQAVILDIRPKKDFATGHIVDAINIPHDKLAARMAELDKHKDKTIIVVDAMGHQAGSFSAQLRKAGYQAAKLSGGIAAWRGDNLPVVK